MEGDNKNQTVIIGMTTKIESIVTAYLMKKQGFNCIGVSITFIDQGASDASEYEKVLEGCQIKDLSEVKKICEHLEIPFYAVNGVNLFKDRVVDNVVACRLSGKALDPCPGCNYIKIDILHEKALKLNADFIATGHYAKVSYNKKLDEYQLVVGNDNLKDQSYYLAGLSQKHLSKLILPLSEMRYLDVVKIVNSIGLTLTQDQMGVNNPYKKVCFNPDNITEFVENRSSITLRQKGQLSFRVDETFITEHTGIHNFFIGQNKISVDQKASIDSSLDVVQINVTNRNVFVGNIDSYTYDYCVVNNFSFSCQMDISQPIRIYCKIANELTKIPCMFYLKNNGIVLIKFTKLYSGILPQGKYVTVYTKDRPGAIVLGGGNVFKSGLYEERQRVKEDEEDDDDEVDEEKIKKIQEFIFRF